MLPPSLDGHGTPTHENGDRALSNPPLYPPASPGARDGTKLTCGAEVCVHARTQNERRKKKKKIGSRQRVLVGGGVQVGTLRCQGCTNRARSGGRQR